MSEYHWIYTTWPDPVEAEAAAELLVREKLAACANLFPGATSLYEWEGEVCREHETILILKTTATTIEALRQRLTDLHPYDVPCFLALPIAATVSSPDFLSWLAKQTRPEM